MGVEVFLRVDEENSKQKELEPSPKVGVSGVLKDLKGDLRRCCREQSEGPGARLGSGRGLEFTLAAGHSPWSPGGTVGLVGKEPSGC